MRSSTFAKKYEDGDLPQPSQVIWDEPQVDYYMRWAKFIYGLYSYGAASAASYCDVRTLRKYYEGSQDIEKYRKIIDTKDPKKVDKSQQNNARHSSIVNISWDNFRIYQKYANIAADKIKRGTKVAPFIRAVDSITNHRRRFAEAKAKVLADERMLDIVELSGMQGSMLRKEDVATATSMGGIVMPIEAAMQAGVNAVIENGGSTIEDLCAIDLVNLGVCAKGVKPCDNGAVVEYVDPEGLICPYNVHPDHRGDQFVARIKEISISSLRVESRLSEDQIVECAKMSSGASDMGMFGLNRRTQFATNNGFYKYDALKVRVLEFHFIAAMAENYIVGSTSARPVIFDKVAKDSKLSKRDKADGKSIETITTQKVYSGYWVIGSDIVYGCSEKEPYRFNGEVVLPIVVQEIIGTSMTQKCLSIIDDMQLAVLKTRQLVASLPSGPPMTIDMSLLEDSIAFGNNTYNTKDMLDVFAATGKLLIRSKSEYGTTNGAARNPVEPIALEVQGAFNVQFDIIAKSIEFIRQMSGVNEIVDGTGTPNRVGNGVADAYMESSNTAIGHIQDALLSAKRGLFFRIVLALQSKSRGGKFSIMSWPVKSTLAYTIEIPEDAGDYTFSVSTRALPTDEDKNMTLAVMAQSVQSGLIGPDVQFMVMSLLRDDNIIAAQLYLSNKVAEGQQRQEKAAMDRIMAQAQANAQAGVAVEQERQRTTAIGKQGDINVAMVKSENSGTFAPQ